MITDYVGHLAALSTSLAWTFTSVFFTLAGREVGSPVVNRTRLLLALGLVALTHWVTMGAPFPAGAEPSRFGWLGLSGVVGFVIGDACLLQAFVMIGPRLAMLLLSLNPVFGTVIAWAWLGETLEAPALAGIALAVGGVALVVSAPAEEPDNPDRLEARTDLRRLAAGVLLGLGGALCQATGLVLSKQGLAGGFPALSGNLIRLVAATLAIWALAALQGQVRAGFDRLRAHPRAWRAIVGGSVAGPFLGVWLSLIAVQNAPVGVASTLMGLAPIILIPVGRVRFGERITPRAVVGTVIAFAGTALLFL
ncbi:MAG: DMT family transporter [Anaerolineae bacterium]|nr:DMT family transporter [Anaerolineae bacterium]